MSCSGLIELKVGKGEGCYEYDNEISSSIKHGKSVR